MYFLFICIISILLISCNSTGINTSSLCYNSFMNGSSSILANGLSKNLNNFNLHKRFGALNIANNNNNNRNSKQKLSSVNPKFPKMFDLMKEKNEIENEQIIKEQKDLVDYLTFELDKILYNENLYDDENNVEDNNIEGENNKNKNNDKKIENIKKEEISEGLNKNDLKNIKMISKFMNKLTLREQKKANFPKAINLLISLHEVDRIIEEKNKLCEGNLIYAQQKKLRSMEEINEHFLNVINIKKEDGKKGLFVNGLNSLKIIELGNQTIEYFELLMSVLPNLTSNEMKEMVENIKNKSRDAGKWVEIGIEYLSERMSENERMMKIKENIKNE